MKCLRNAKPTEHVNDRRAAPAYASSTAPTATADSAANACPARRAAPLPPLCAAATAASEADARADEATSPLAMRAGTLAVVTGDGEGL